jgi:hypothetical protein
MPDTLPSPPSHRSHWEIAAAYDDRARRQREDDDAAGAEVEARQKKVHDQQTAEQAEWAIQRDRLEVAATAARRDLAHASAGTLDKEARNRLRRSSFEREAATLLSEAKQALDVHLATNTRYR